MAESEGNPEDINATDLATEPSTDAAQLLSESYDELELLMPGLKERFTAMTETQRDELIGHLQFVSSMDDSLPE